MNTRFRSLFHNTRQIKDLRDFMDRVKEVQTRWFKADQPGRKVQEGSLWFRGQSSSDWGLSPRLYRREYEGADENEIRQEFQSRALQLIQGRLPEEKWEWYFLMQHYGASTRLLDWTDNPLVALYFAVEDHPGKGDAAVWIVDPWWVNRQLKRGIEGAMLPDWEEAERYLPDLEESFAGRRVAVRLPAAIDPPYVDRRLATQASRFTIFGRTRDLTKSEAARSRRRRLVQIVIPRSTVGSIKSELQFVGITVSLMFPDLAGLCKEICGKWKQPASAKKE